MKVRIWAFLILGVYDDEDRRLVDLLSEVKVDGATMEISECFLKAGFRDRFGHDPDLEMLAAFIAEYFENWGREFRKLHDAGYLHLRPHFGNFGINGGDVFVCDLSSSKRKRSLKPKHSFTYQLVGDLAVSLESVFDFIDQTEIGYLLVRLQSVPLVLKRVFFRHLR